MPAQLCMRAVLLLLQVVLYQVADGIILGYLSGED